MDKKNAYFLSLFIMLFVMFVPTVATMKKVTSAWYKCIRPSISPPNYVFPIVWTFLYIMVGFALAQTFMLQESIDKNILLYLYGYNLLLNMLWSFAYFGTENVSLAFVILLAMIISAAFILYYTWLLLPVSVFYILVPYMMWICFAGLLNFLSLGKKC
jgi:tryptophan-rich sensory protein